MPPCCVHAFFPHQPFVADPERGQGALMRNVRAELDIYGIPALALIVLITFISGFSPPASPWVYRGEFSGRPLVGRHGYG